MNNNRTQSTHTGSGDAGNPTTTYYYNGDDELTSQTSGGITTNNTYDANGSLKTSTAGTSVTTYTYDVRNKLVGYSQGSTSATYTYDDDGDRVSETVGGVTTVYLTDTQNPTGYDQPVEATAGSTRTTYILGDRVLGQADTSGNVSYLLVDGHGSTRALTNSSGLITQTFNYDAFGTALNFNPAASTTGTVFLFGGDAIYDPTSGLYLHGDGVRATKGFSFIQRDNFGGSARDPLSLHKYLYAGADPVNANDPTGQFADILISTAGDFAMEGAQDAIDAGAEGYAFGVIDDIEIDQGTDLGLEAADDVSSSESNELTKDALNEEEQTADPNENEEDDDDKDSQYLFHYTSSAAAAAIFATQIMWASPALPGLPSGAYATDIGPYTITMSQSQLANLLFPPNVAPTKDLSWCDIIEDDDNEFQSVAPAQWVLPAPYPSDVPVHVVAVVPNLMPKD